MKVKLSISCIPLTFIWRTKYHLIFQFDKHDVIQMDGILSKWLKLCGYLFKWLNNVTSFIFNNTQTLSVYVYIPHLQCVIAHLVNCRCNTWQFSHGPLMKQAPTKYNRCVNTATLDRSTTNELFPLESYCWYSRQCIYVIPRNPIVPCEWMHWERQFFFYSFEPKWEWKTAKQYKHVHQFISPVFAFACRTMVWNWTSYLLCSPCLSLSLGMETNLKWISHNQAIYNQSVKSHIC